MTQRKKIKLAFVDFWDWGEDIQQFPLYQLLGKRFDIELSDTPDVAIFSCFGDAHKRFRCKKIFYTGENVAPNFNLCDFALSFELLDDPRHFRFPLFCLYQIFEEVRQAKRAIPDNAHTREFCSFLYSNTKASERIDFFHVLSRYKKVSSGGKVLNNLGYNVDDKLSFLKQYKFTIAFENSSHPGYVTEKILEAFAAQAIPIYWGNPAITADFNPKSFINCHDFKSWEDVAAHVAEVDRDQALYESFYHDPVFSVSAADSYLSQDSVLDFFDMAFDAQLDHPVARRPKNTFSYLRATFINRLMKLAEGSR